MSVPIMRALLPPPASVVPRLEDIGRSGTYSNFGPQVTELEARYADLLNVPPDRVVTVANATLALAGAVAIATPSTWSIPSFTFTASVAAALLAADHVVLHDIDPAEWWVDATGASSSDGVMAVAPFGSPVDLERWKGRGEAVIDAAASLGSLPDLSDLPEAWAVVFSLHATKVLGAGEGAVAVLGSAERAQLLRMWTNFGFSGARESQLAGLNAKMSELQAAYAHAVLDGWEQERAEWIAARDRVLRVGDEVGLTTFHASREQVTPYWIAVLPDAATTDVVERVLEDHGVGTRRWWSRGCHRMPAYAGVPHGPLPVTEDVADRYLGLPLYRGLSEEDAECVYAALLDARDRADAW